MPKATKAKMTTTSDATLPVVPVVDVQAALDEAQMLLYRDRRRAHETLFDGANRKSHTTPPFHWEMIDDFHSPIPNLLQIAFRGAAKSTRGEEGVCIRSLFREFRYCLIVSSVSDIAQMRLHAIKKQFEINENILEIFGNLRSKVWGDEQIELSTGIVMRAVGRGQAIRGGKETDMRPDFIWLDDIEDFKAVANEKQIKKTLEWFDGELVGSADAPNLRMRMQANDMGPDCLANKLKQSSEWVYRVYPWIKDGKSIWEDRYPLTACLSKRAEMYARGSGDEYEREYMCNSSRPEAKTFREDFFKIENHVRLFEPVYAMIVPGTIDDAPLRTAPCAAAVWSWIGGKCFVWECWTKNLQTHEIIAETKRIDAEYQPVSVGFAEDAYDAWAHAQLVLPAITPIKEPKSAAEFIRALQPFFIEKKIIFSQPLPDATAQLLSFPNGPVDALTAMAHALHPDMREGMIFYKDFSGQNVMVDLEPEPGPMMLALNADDNHVAGALCQVTGAGFRVFADWVSAPGTTDAARDMIQSANILAQRHCAVIMPQPGRTKNKLAPELRRMGMQIGAGSDIGEGRREFYKLLREQSRGLSRLLVSDKARWTRNAFAAGYKINLFDGPYGVLMGALESIAALSSLDGDDDKRSNSVSRDGRSFYSARSKVTHA